VAIIIEEDATICSLFISVNCPTCFGWYLHTSSGARITVSTGSGINGTVTATCCERDWMGTSSTYYTMHGPLNIKVHEDEDVYGALVE
jgi:hypothetical protein